MAVLFITGCSEQEGALYTDAEIREQFLQTPVLRDLPFTPIDLKILEVRESDKGLDVTANLIYRTLNKDINDLKARAVKEGVKTEKKVGFALREFIKNSFQVNKRKIVSYKTVTIPFIYNPASQKWIISPPVFND
jgi:hypothetical protein